MKKLLIIIFFLFNFNLTADIEPLPLPYDAFEQQAFISSLQSYIRTNEIYHIMRYIPQEYNVQMDGITYNFSGEETSQLFETVFSRYPIRQYSLLFSNKDRSIYMITWTSYYDKRFPINKKIKILLFNFKLWVIVIE